jgi:hypothetical protein
MPYPVEKRDRVRVYSKDLEKEWSVVAQDTKVIMKSDKDQEVEFSCKDVKFQKWNALGTAFDEDFSMFTRFGDVESDVVANKSAADAQVAALQAQVSTNATAVTSAQTTLQANIDAETVARTTADNILTASVAAIDVAYKAADSASAVSDAAARAVVQASLDAHKTAYNAKVAAIDNSILFLTSNTTAQIDSVADLLSEINLVKSDMGDDADPNNSLVDVISSNVTRLAAIEAMLAQLTES